MHELCHRCGGDLPPGDSGQARAMFCPHCAAPQLSLAQTFLADAVDPSNAGTTGAPPPPAPREVDWQIALRCALAVAGIAVVLLLFALRLPGLTLVSLVWMLTASLSTLVLYQRRRPRAWMDAVVGARIGLSTGLMLIAAVGSAAIVGGLTARFGLHTMGGFDAGFAQMLAQGRIAAANAPTPTPPEALRLYDIPEFQAGVLLASTAFGCCVLLALTTAGGAVGGLLRARRPTGSS